MQTRRWKRRKEDKYRKDEGEATRVKTTMEMQKGWKNYREMQTREQKQKRRWKCRNGERKGDECRKDD
jgi:hypothetical protein